MKVVVAIDSFKGSLSSMEAGMAARRGILAAKPEADVVVKPLADGGEGTVDALIEGLGGKKVHVIVTGPTGHKVACYYGFLEKTGTAVIEMASAAGITLMNKNDPLHATTHGVGEIILDAAKKGCKNFIIGIGGSATNDGGIGMLKALGISFLDADGNDVGEGGQALHKIVSIDQSHLNPLLDGCQFQVACDVTNPLCGPNGATYIYGPQKGVTDDFIEELDQAMAHYADVTTSVLGCDYSHTEGAGAAGGLGFAFLSYLKASLTPGIDLILNAVDLEKELTDADIVVTGEGRLDYQTSMGKAPIGVAKLAKKYKAKTIAFAGSVSADASTCNQAGIDAFFPILQQVTTLEEAMNPTQAASNLEKTAEQVFRLL
ncbi:MAG: glycerate kinase [Lachnospiraceae bacterium]|nr:glycerate kinase [Lachnospiraceae bacterium]